MSKMIGADELPIVIYRQLGCVAMLAATLTPVQNCTAAVRWKAAVANVNDEQSMCQVMVCGGLTQIKRMTRPWSPSLRSPWKRHRRLLRPLST